MQPTQTPPRSFAVHPGRRFLAHADGRPFFFLGDTAWEMFHRLNEAQAEFYLRDRAAKGFNVIQAVVLAEERGLDVPNANGDLPFTDPYDPRTPNERYFRYVDRLVELAADLGLAMGMAPTWGDKWNQRWGVGPEIFTPENSREYGRFLGRRYRDQPVIWIMGGDRGIENEMHRAINQAMAEGVREGSGGGQLMTFHPWSNHSSSAYFHDAAWLDFNFWQGGHDRSRQNHAMIAGDYARRPVKPTMDGEPCYEHHPNAQDLTQRWLDDRDVRRAFYGSVFAGGCGFTYGCHEVWQFWEPGRSAVNSAHTPWPEALRQPGATQVGHGRRLMESRPYFGRVPDQTLIAGDNPDGAEHMTATRDADGSYAFVYLPLGQAVTVRTGALTGAALSVHWFNPRTGEATFAGEQSNTGEAVFVPPGQGHGNDWVLVLDDAARGFPLPGQGEFT